MDVTLPTQLLIALLVFVVAALYSSVGHGGASGYLAVMALFAVPPELMAGTALVLNVLVAGLASVSFVSAGLLVPRLLLPFVITSVPFAFLGGYLKISDKLYYLLLALALLVAAFRLTLSAAGKKAEGEAARRIPLGLALPAGGGIGLLSGMVGVGGGIFLSPLLILARWATARQSAALAAVFILVNSLAGLAGRVARGNLDLLPAAGLLVAALAGGIVGSYIGSRRLGGLALRRVLAVVLLLACVKLVGTAL